MNDLMINHILKIFLHFFSPFLIRMETSCNESFIEYLAYFASPKEEFRLPELDAITKLFNIPIYYDKATDLKQVGYL